MALIGAGPASISALQGFVRGESIAVVSGTSSRVVPRVAVHPKIQAVSTFHNESPGVVHAYRRASSDRGPLFSSALAGGFANYWGQQFLRYESGDPWPREVFEDFASYQDHCAEVERGFVFTGGADVSMSPSGRTDYSARLPRLLIGAAESPSSDLMAMRHAFRAHVDRTKAQVFDTRAKSFERARGDWKVHLDEGEAIHAKKVILAAGVLGTSQLLGNSFQDIRGARLSDHAPWMLYGIGLHKLFAQRPMSSRQHFNAITLEKLENKACTVFASLYDMGRADLNLLLASTIGRTFRSFRKFRAPPGSSLIKPVQIWTPSTFDEIDVDLGAGTVKEVPGRHGSARDDRGLGEALDVLRDLGTRCMRITRTLPGYGFHYHNLTIRAAGASHVSVADFLRERTEGDVVCVDASILPSIGLRPHTLTAMATSLRLVKRLVQSN